MNTWSCAKSEAKIPQPRSAHGVLTKILIYLAMQLLKVEDCKMICKEFTQSWDTETLQCPHSDYSWIVTGCAPIKQQFSFYDCWGYTLLSIQVLPYANYGFYKNIHIISSFHNFDARYSRSLQVHWPINGIIDSLQEQNELIIKGGLISFLLCFYRKIIVLSILYLW